MSGPFNDESDRCALPGCGRSLSWHVRGYAGHVFVEAAAAADASAKAEAESIATRWVPAHMTARQGLVDDIALAIVTSRRLVEEAQGDLTAARDALIREGMERDRLKGEMAEARAATNEIIQALTEARNFVRRAAKDVRKLIQPSRFDLDAADLVDKWDGAATPAEQAQGEAAPPIDEEHRHIRSALTKTACRIDDRVDALAASLDRITSPPSRPFVSEIKRHWDDPAVRDNFVDAMLDDHEARLRDLEWRFKTTDPDAAAPTCRKLIESLGALCTRRLDHGGGCEHDTREAVSPIPGGGAR
jgi:hypothetical protein